MTEVGQWLAQLGLDQYAELFEKNEIRADVLVDLTDADLKELGVSLGDRKRLLRAIGTLRDAKNEALISGAHSLETRTSNFQAERRQLTVMFADLVGSTALSARFDPEEMCEILRAYHNAVTSEIKRFAGYVVRYMGDGVLACFGWPEAHEDAAERAVWAGLDLVRAVEQLSTPTGNFLTCRVGIATGLVVVGDLIGEGAARENAVVGETPNLAARLQQLAEPGQVVIAPSTLRLLGSIFDLAEIGVQTIKGFADPVRVWRVVGANRAEGRFESFHGTTLPPLVGRKQELGLLFDRWRRAKGGEGQVVLLSGEPGIGKSRLVLALREQLTLGSDRCLRYNGSPRHTNSALWPVIQQLERAAEFAGEDTVETKLRKLEAILRQTAGATATALLADLLGVPTGNRYQPLELTPQQKKALTFGVLLGQLEGIARQRPVLVIVEDAHWLDPTTLELFEQVVHRIKHLPVLLIVNFRPELKLTWTVHPHVTALSLSRLDRNEATAVAAQIARKALPDAALHEIVSRTDGVPLFVEELTKMVIEAGLLADVGNQLELRDVLPPLAIPTTLQDSLMARLDRLAPFKNVAQIGAVIGREFDHALLTALADQPGDELDEALARLVEAGLILRRGTSRDAIYSFKHALVQDAAYQSLLKRHRQELHARIAETLEQRFTNTVAVRPELVAHHYAQAGLINKAVPYHLQAGRNAIMLSATIEAMDQLKAGFKLLEELPKGLERSQLELSLQLALGDVLRASVGTAAIETGAAYAQAGSLAVQLKANHEIIRARYGEFLSCFNRAEFSEARKIVDELRQAAEQLNRIEACAIGLDAAGLVAFSTGDLVSARALLERLISARQNKSEPELGGDINDAVSILYLAWTLLILGYPEQAHWRCRQGLEAGEGTRQPSIFAIVLANSCYFYHLRRDWSAVRSNSERVIEIASERVMPACLEVGMAFRGLILAREGKVSEGISLMEHSLQEALRTRFLIEMPYSLSQLAEAYYKAERFADAFQTIDSALARANSTGERWFEAELRRLRGEFAARKPEPDEMMAEDFLLSALGVAKAQGAKWWELRAAMSLAGFWLERGARQQAYDLLAPIYGWFTEGFDTPDLLDAKALLNSLR